MAAENLKLQLRRRSDMTSASIVVLHLGATYAPVYLAAIIGPSPLVFVCWLWFGLLNNGVINLLHECAHKLTFKRGWANEFLGGYVLAPLVLTDFESYRHRHWEHHRYLGGGRDGKLVYRSAFKGTAIWRLLGRSLLGVEALRRLGERPQDPSGEAGIKRPGLSAKLVGAQVTFIASLVVTAIQSHPTIIGAVLSAGLAYGLVYGHGLGSLTVFAAALRAIAEHQKTGNDSCSQGDAALRNLRCNPVTRLLFGAYGFGEHATHHLEPGVPYYRLPAATEVMARSNPGLVPGAGYITTLLRLSRR